MKRADFVRAWRKKVRPKHRNKRHRHRAQELLLVGGPLHNRRMQVQGLPAHVDVKVGDAAGCMVRYMQSHSRAEYWVYEYQEGGDSGTC